MGTLSEISLCPFRLLFHTFHVPDVVNGVVRVTRGSMQSRPLFQTLAVLTVEIV